MNNNDYREVTEDEATTVSTSSKDEINGQENSSDTHDVSEHEKETAEAECRHTGGERNGIRRYLLYLPQTGTYCRKDDTDTE